MLRLVLMGFIFGIEVGKMPASQANEEVVAAHRKEEWELTKAILKYYESVCLGLKVIWSF